MALDQGATPEISDRRYFERLWMANTQTKIMAEIYGLPKERVFYWAHKHKLRPRTPKGRVILIHERDFKLMWDRGDHIGDIAKKISGSVNAVQRLVEFFDLAARPVRSVVDERKAIRAAEPKPRVAGSDFWTASRDNKVRETGGRYSDVAKLAKAMKVPSTKIMARWHRLRAA